MKNIIVIALVGTLLITQTFAACPKPVTKLAKGAKAPCAGIFFSPEKEKEIRLANEKHKITLEQLGIQKQMIEIYRKDNDNVVKIVDKERQKSELWRTAAEDSTQKLIKVESSRGNRDWIFFTLGIFTTGLAAYGLSKIRR